MLLLLPPPPPPPLLLLLMPAAGPPKLLLGWAGEVFIDGVDGHASEPMPEPAASKGAGPPSHSSTV